MRILVQQVKEAKVVIDGRTHAEIGQGLLAFLGIHKDDHAGLCPRLAERLVNLRIFPDAEGKTNLSVKDVDGSILIVSQFTLYGDCSKGRRPSFIESAPPPTAKPIYEDFLLAASKEWPKISSGVFGAYMLVHLVNDGPHTFILESS